MLRHDGGGSEDGEDEGDAAPDGLLAVEHRPLGHEQLQRYKMSNSQVSQSASINACLLLVVDPPGDDGAAVEVDGAGGVVAAVQHHHRGRRHRSRSLWSPRKELYTSEMILYDFPIWSLIP